jgi:vancomycin resistance protein VanJ
MAWEISIRVLTFNIGNGCADPDVLIRRIRESGCDLVGMQEVSRIQGAALERELAELYPHRVIHPEGLAGKALLSRHPIVEHEMVLLECGRPHLRARVAVAGRTLQILVAHVPLEHTLFSLIGKARREIDELARRTMLAPPGLLVGDFNKTPFSLLHRRLRRSGLLDAFQESGTGPGFTFPVFRRFRGIPLPPLVRIDYVWHTPDVRVRACWQGSDGGSDHLPVTAELEL